MGAIAVAIAGIVPSMAETYYTGPIALMVASPYGGDLGASLDAFLLRRWLGADACFTFDRVRILGGLHVSVVPVLPDARDQVLQAVKTAGL